MALPSGELARERLRGLAGRFLIALETLAIGLTVCALSVKACGFASSPFGGAGCEQREQTEGVSLRRAFQIVKDKRGWCTAVHLPLL